MKILNLTGKESRYLYYLVTKQIIQLQKLDKKVLKKSPFKQEYESFLEIQKKLFKHV